MTGNSKYTEFPHQSDPGRPTSQANQRRQSQTPGQLVTGIMRGKLGVGGQGVLIDNPGQRITITDNLGNTVGFGRLPDNTSIGFFTEDSSGNVIKTTVGGTDSFYDADGNLLQKIEAGVQYFYNTDGDLIMKIEAGTIFFYDPDNGTNSGQIGLLPDLTYNAAFAKAGFDVADGITP